ncbi:MAG: hypothetical protein AB8B95_09270 [Pseudohongiellaceae bacterium]
MVPSTHAIAKDSGPENTNSLIGTSQPADTTYSNKFRLLNLLQSTLDLETLLKYFLESLREELPIGGLSYDDEARGISLRIGKQSTHSCGYNLTTQSVDCGEIVFKRDSRFTEIELHTIEQKIVLLLAPISNAIKYAEAVEFANRNIAKQLIDRETLGITLHREIELAKRHNHPLTVANILVRTNPQLGRLGKKDERIGNFADHLYKEKDSTHMLYRVGEQEFLLIASGDEQCTAAATRAMINSAESEFDGSGAPELTFKVGYASVTGTDSVSSVLSRAKKQNAAVD